MIVEIYKNKIIKQEQIFEADKFSPVYTLFLNTEEEIRMCEQLATKIF